MCFPLPILSLDIFILNIVPPWGQGVFSDILEASPLISPSAFYPNIDITQQLYLHPRHSPHRKPGSSHTQEPGLHSVGQIILGNIKIPDLG